MKTGVRKLTEKQRKFVAEYQVDMNGTQAAIRAGYSAKTAEVIANGLLKKSWVSEEIEKQTEAALHKVGVRRDKVLTRMAQLSFHDIRRLYDPETNCLLPVKNFPDDLVAAIAGIETLEVWEGKGEDRHLVGYTKKVRLWDPNPALTNMAKNLGVIGNGKHEEKEVDEEEIVKTMTTLQLSQRIVFLVKMAVDNVRKLEAEKKEENLKQEQKRVKRRGVST